MHKSVVEAFDYDALDEVTRVLVVRKADETRGLLKRTAQNILVIGKNLQEVKERLPHGKFLPWLHDEFAMTERHARNFMHAAARFENKSEIISDLSVTVIYELAAPSTPETVIEHVMEGQVAPTVEAVRRAKEAELRARVAEERVSAELAALQAQLAQERAEAAEQIRQLSLRMEHVQQRLAQLSVPPAPKIKESPVVPADVSAQLTTLRRQVESLTAQRDALVKRARELEAQAQQVEAKREEEQYAREICLAWSNATATLHTSLLKFLAQFPDPQQVQVFEAVDWNRLTQAEAMLQRGTG